MHLNKLFESFIIPFHGLPKSQPGVEFFFNVQQLHSHCKINFQLDSQIPLKLQLVVDLYFSESTRR